MPFPNPDTQFKPGQSGNPDGYSRSRRLTDAVERLIVEHGLDKPLAMAWLGAAMGDKKLLQGKDGRGRAYTRKPHAAFFSMLLERLEGRVPQPIELAPEEGRLSDALESELMQNLAIYRDPEPRSLPAPGGSGEGAGEGMGVAGTEPPGPP